MRRSRFCAACELPLGLGLLYVTANHCGFLQVPASVCTRDCLEGHHRVVVGSHHCCFECMPCEAGTFLNKSGE